MLMFLSYCSKPLDVEIKDFSNHKRPQRVKTLFKNSFCVKDFLSLISILLSATLLEYNKVICEEIKEFVLILPPVICLLRHYSGEVANKNNRDDLF